MLERGNLEIQGEEEKKKKKKKHTWRKIFGFMLKHKIASLVIILGIILLVKFGLIPAIRGDFKEKTTIVSDTSLERILRISDISTYRTTYNGVAKVCDEKNQDKVLYYVSYEASVKAGIDMNEVKTDVDKDNKIIKVTLPEVKITDLSVDMTKLDYMFKAWGADTETVSKDAYEAAVEDAEGECNDNTAIKEFARDNVENLIKGLLNPVLENADEAYTLEIE